MLISTFLKEIALVRGVEVPERQKNNEMMNENNEITPTFI